MDAIEILGSLLGGGGKGSGGLGGKILTEIMKGGAAPRQPAPQPVPAPSGRSVPPTIRPTDIEREASELEDLLNVAKGKVQQRPQAPTKPAAVPMPQSFPRSAPQVEAPKSNSPFQFPTSRERYSPPPPRRNPSPDYRNDAQQQNEDALVLVRAMINAAKSDGEISQEEQQSILERIGNPTQEVIDFLRQEFSQPLDVREWAWSVPIGMEQKVYTISLAAIEINQNSEATYLRDLAHGLRLPPEVCNQIHQQFNAPTIF